MAAEQRLRDALRLILEDTDAAAETSARRQRAQRNQPERWRGTAAAYPPDWEDGGRVDYFYRRDTILVRTPDADLVTDKLAEFYPDLDVERIVLAVWQNLSRRREEACSHAGPDLPGR
jgi:hypothetical protein